MIKMKKLIIILIGLAVIECTPNVLERATEAEAVETRTTMGSYEFTEGGIEQIWGD